VGAGKHAEPHCVFAARVADWPFSLAPRHDLSGLWWPSLRFFRSDGNQAFPVANPKSDGPRLWPAWIEIAGPLTFSALKTPEFSGDATRLCRTAASNGGGPPGHLWSSRVRMRPRLCLNLLIYQPGNEATPDSSFYVELARRAAETGRAIIRGGAAGGDGHRFGAFEVARLGLARDSASPQECLGFVSPTMEPRPAHHGFALRRRCGACLALTSKSGASLPHRPARPRAGNRRQGSH